MEVFLRVEAREELRKAATWYEQQRAGLGDAFLDDFLGTIEALESNPRLFAQIGPGIRRALLRRFPYAMFYSIEQSHIQVLAIQHSHGDPAEWPTGA